MKKIFAAATLALLYSCSGVAGWSGNSDSTQTAGFDSSEVVRDLSINESNAYSDLFLDSGAIENYIREEGMADTTARRFRDFYAVRNNQYAWLTTQGFTEQARGVWSLYSSEGTDSVKKKERNKEEGNEDLRERMDTLLQRDSLSIARNDSAFVETELALTHELLQYASKHPDGPVNLANVYYLVPARRMEVMQLADSILNKQKDSARYSSNKAYTALRQQLALYHAAEKKGGWQPVSVTALKKGMRAPAVAALKKRLQASGDYGTNDTTDMYSDSLISALRDYQQRHGLSPSGALNDSTVQALNVPARERMEQIILNLNRMQWVSTPQESNYLQVNIPSFMLYAYEGANRVMEMPVIVGKEGTGTVMFSGNINQIVFNPYWNIPQSIVRDELMPKMKEDPAYLKKRHMEIVKQNDSLPVVRQLPGPDNSLGQMKFLFPNSFDIFLHDTPHKELFGQKDRALSHGCIRLQNASLLAEYLLRGQSGWDARKIQTTLSTNKEQPVNLSTPHPVVISYFTAWVDERGKMNFRPDVYGHDAKASGRMFL